MRVISFGERIREIRQVLFPRQPQPQPSSKGERGIFRDLNEISLLIPELPPPSLERIQERFGFIKSIFDTSLTGTGVLRFGTVLYSGEDWIDGEEYNRRLLALPAGGRPGYQHAEWAEREQYKNKGCVLMVPSIGKCIHFPGLIAVDASQGLLVPCLDREEWRLVLVWRRLADGFSHLLLSGHLGRLGRIAIAK